MPSFDLSQFIVSENLPIIEAMEIINKNSHRMVFVCDNTFVLATLTDGDVRRHILAGKSLTALVSEAANYHFYFLPVGSNQDEVCKLCDELRTNVIPGLDKDGKLATLFFKDENIESIANKIDLLVIIMAGGKGTRLHPYTKILPKPLIPIGEVTITDHIINNFAKFGCKKFTMIVNHKKEMIKAYFSENDRDGFSIDFLDEDTYLGTGGGLSLLRSKISDSFFFTNCDILVLCDYNDIYEQHKSAGNLLTMVCSTKTFVVPYGTVEVNTIGRIKSLMEKPSYSFLTNTGFYIIEPGFFDHVPNDTFIHITDIIQNCIDNGEKIGIYPISENQWYDMGNHEDMEKMINKIVQ
jgi:dTDP-glucose pyrophosphorylase